MPSGHRESVWPAEVPEFRFLTNSLGSKSLKRQAEASSPKKVQNPCESQVWATRGQVEESHSLHKVVQGKAMHRPTQLFQVEGRVVGGHILSLVHMPACER